MHVLRNFRVFLGAGWTRAGRLTRLTCDRGRTLRVVGLTPVGRHNRRLPAAAAEHCAHLSTLRRHVAAACDGRRRCYVSPADLSVSRDQCPGLVAVFVDVSCTVAARDAGTCTLLATRHLLLAVADISAALSPTNHMPRLCQIFNARCCASAVLAMARCLSVSVSVCLSVTSHKSEFY